MKVFKLYLKLFRSYAIVALVYVVIFFGISLAVTSSLEKTSEQFRETKMNVYLDNLDFDSELSRGLVEYLEKFAEYKDIEEKNLSDALHFRQISAIIIIPENFEKDFLAGADSLIEMEKIDESASSATIENGIEKYLNYTRVYLNETNKDLNEVLVLVENVLNSETETIILGEESDELYNIGFYFNSLSYILNAIILTVVGLLSISFRKLEVRRRLIVSPYPESKSNFEMILGNGLFTAALVVLFCGASFVLAPNPMKTENGFLHVLNVIIFSFAVLSMSYFFSLLIKKEQVLTGVNNVFSLGAAFITGAFVPQELLSEGMLRFAHILPNYYYIYNSNLISSTYNLSSANYNKIILYFGIQVLFAVGFVVLSILLSKKLVKSES